MILQDITEIIKIIEKINGEISSLFCENFIDEYLIPYIKMETNGTEIGLEFLGMNIWDSENYNKPTESYLKGEINKIINTVKLIKLDSSRERYELGPIPEVFKDYMMEEVPDILYTKNDLSETVKLCPFCTKDNDHPVFHSEDKIEECKKEYEKR